MSRYGKHLVWVTATTILAIAMLFFALAQDMVVAVALCIAMTLGTIGVILSDPNDYAEFRRPTKKRS